LAAHSLQAMTDADATRVVDQEKAFLGASARPCVRGGEERI